MEERYRAVPNGVTIPTSRARTVSSHWLPIPSGAQWCNDTHQPCTRCQQPLAADTEQHPMVYRLPPVIVTHWLSALPTALAVRPADMQKPRL